MNSGRATTEGGTRDGGEEGSRPDVRFSAAVQTDPSDGLPRHVTGEMLIRGWHPVGGTGDFCLYLPYEDPYAVEGLGTSRRFEMISAKQPRLRFEGGHLEVTLAAPVTAVPGPGHVLRLTLPPGAAEAGEVALAFTSEVPRLAKSDPANWVYDGFLPELLATCPPPEGQDPVYNRRPVAAKVTGELTVPPGWDFAGPGTPLPGGRIGFDLTARTVAFALGKGYRSLAFTVAGIPVTLLYHEDGFEDLAETLKATLPTYVRMFGPYPFPSLTVVETHELQRHGLPGLIAMNRPHQMVFAHVERRWMNWQHWILAIQLARQWYGGAVAAQSADDDWLVDGLAEFATGEALAHDPPRYNLFNPIGGLRLLSFDYRQISDMMAATLANASPFAALTTPDLVTRDPQPQQHPLLYVKQAVALRQLKSYAGESAFFGLLRRLTQTYSGGFLTPRDFARHLARLPSPFPPPVRADLESFLTRWWVNEGWPDFVLGDFTSEPLPDGHWISHLSAAQAGTIDFPPLLGIDDGTGRTLVTRAARGAAGEPGWQGTLVTPYKPVAATVDPTHEAFDSDRFNNSSRWPGVGFFPGNADTLKDDAYTVLWLPYAFKRPGQPFSLGLQAALFRYVQSGLLARVEWAPGTNLGAFNLSQVYSIPSSALTGMVNLTGDYYNNRQAEVTLKRSPLFAPTNPNLALEVRARHKLQAGEPETEHSTFVVDATLQPVNVTRRCDYSLLASYEKAPRELAKGPFDYARSFGTASGGCYLSQRVKLDLRAFRGVTTGQGPIPQSGFFRPVELTEARLRLAQQGSSVVSDITSGSVDVYFPFFLPLPGDTLILARQMRWRLYYDQGHSMSAATDYRAAGFGFLLPFGGDLAGAGTLALTRFSFLIVGYSQVGSDVTRKPTLLFDLTGDL